MIAVMITVTYNARIEKDSLIPIYKDYKNETENPVSFEEWVEKIFIPQINLDDAEDWVANEDILANYEAQLID